MLSLFRRSANKQNINKDYLERLINIYCSIISNYIRLELSEQLKDYTRLKSEFESAEPDIIINIITDLINKSVDKTNIQKIISIETYNRLVEYVGSENILLDYIKLYITDSITKDYVK